MQPFGTKLIPHWTKPKSFTTPGSNWNVLGLNITGLDPAVLSRSTPLYGSTANRDELNLLASQF